MGLWPTGYFAAGRSMVEPRYSQVLLNVTEAAALGQGLMGSGIAQNLLKAGFLLTI